MKTKVPVYCYQCVCGPDLLKVEVEDGVAVRVESNLDVKEEHPGCGRVCIKAYGMIQKTYNPNRIQQPMKRTNPKKGRTEDPGFVPVSWDEALDMVAGKLNEIRGKGVKDEAGYPRLAVSFGGGGTPARYMGAFPAFLSAWGPVDFGFGSGQGAKCYHAEHLYGELWHRAFTVAADTPNCDYIINCGNNQEASAGVGGAWRQADARNRGLKRVQAEPHLSITGAASAEWLPIKPKTDAAFLYGIIHCILYEHNWEEACDVPFIANATNSPYLVAPNGYYLRDPEAGLPLIWDDHNGAARPFNSAIGKPALTGRFIASGTEIGADKERWEHAAVEVQPAFQLFMDHMRQYTPEWAQAECDIPAHKIRQIAAEFLSHARVGETIEVEGETMPLRPVAILLGKSVNNGWGAYQACWARTMLAILAGALEVPGGTLGTKVRLNRPADNRFKSVKPHQDGFMEYPFNETTIEEWQNKPDIRNGYRTLVPLSANSPWSAALGPAHLPWLFQKEQPKAWPKQTLPDMWICYRTNPAISSWQAPEVARRIAEFPFTVAFAYTLDETNFMADVLLPDATDLESLQLSRIGGTGSGEQFWKHRGWAIRQPAVENVTDSMDMSDIGAELAVRCGLLDQFNAAVNRGSAGMRLKTDDFDYSLDINRKHSCEEIYDAVAKAASHELSGGEEIHDIQWFKQHGFMLRPISQKEWYLYPHLKKMGLRFELPYQERIRRHGRQLANRLHETGIDWWEKQLAEYEALPAYKPFPDIWIEYANEVGRNPEEFPFWALTARSMQYAWGANSGLPIINEVAENIAGHNGVILNRQTASGLGIKDGDAVLIESVTGSTRSRAVLREGIRPDTLVLLAQFDHWAMPYAKDFDRGSLNSLTALALSLTDNTGSGADIMRVKIKKLEGAAREAV